MLGKEPSGYVHFGMMPVVDSLGYQPFWQELAGSFSSLPPDPFKPDSVKRNRRYSYAFIDRVTNELQWPPAAFASTCSYFQGGFNPEHSGEARAFPSIPAAILRNPVLRLLIESDFSKVHWSSENLNPIKVGVHLVSQLVDGDSPVSVASPDCLHRDGEPYTFAHLVERTGILGGENTIATIDAVGKKSTELTSSERLTCFTLTQPLESYGVCDRLVSHAVDPIRLAPGEMAGSRDVILIDFTPSLPVLDKA